MIDCLRLVGRISEEETPEEQTLEEQTLEEQILEARAGIEPAIEVLQTSALPLGYRAPFDASS